MTRWARISVSAVCAFVAGLSYLAVAGGPFVPPDIAFVPGGPLTGEEGALPVRDWGFAASRAHVDVESRSGRWPLSSKVYSEVRDGRLYLIIRSVEGADLTERLFFGPHHLKERIDRDPRVRVRVDGRVYAQRAVPYREPDRVEVIAPSLLRTTGIRLGGRLGPVEHPLGAHTEVYLLENPRQGARRP